MQETNDYKTTRVKNLGTLCRAYRRSGPYLTITVPPIRRGFGCTLTEDILQIDSYRIVPFPGSFGHPFAQIYLTRLGGGAAWVGSKR